MPNTAQNLISLDAFLVWEREQPERYEYADAVVTMMTGGSAALNLTMALRQALRGTGCRPFGDDMKVIANDTARHRAGGSLAKEIRLLRYTIDPAIRDH